jgi:hypothetical protein
MKTPSVAIGLTALLVLILFTVSSFGLVTYFLAITLLGFLVLFLANSNLINIAFLVFLPTNDIFHKEDFLFSFLGTQANPVVFCNTILSEKLEIHQTKILSYQI